MREKVTEFSLHNSDCERAPAFVFSVHSEYLCMGFSNERRSYFFHSNVLCSKSCYSSFQGLFAPHYTFYYFLTKGLNQGASHSKKQTSTRLNLEAHAVLILLIYSYQCSFVLISKSNCQRTSLGVMMTDKITPSSSSVAPGEATKTGSDGNRPGWRHTCRHGRSRENNSLSITKLPSQPVLSVAW